MFTWLIAAALLSVQDGANTLAIECENAQIDAGKSVFLDITVEGAPEAQLPDMRDRVRGFSLAEEDVEESVRLKDGRIRQTAHWRLVPEPCAKAYKIAPFAFGAKVAGPVYFESPAPLEAAKGPMEIEPKKVFPPLTPKRLLRWFLWTLGAAAGAYALFFLAKTLFRKAKEHRMSPVERAWAELERLMKKGLPGRGRYKDFYVELTQVVRRYVQRQHGLKAPHLTTEEFFEAARKSERFPAETLEELMEFMHKADMVKFAGVEATPETTDEATESARRYIAKDDGIVKANAAKKVPAAGKGDAQ